MLKNTLASTRNELKTTKENLRKQKEESERQLAHQDDLEQYIRKNSLEIYGIPQDAYPSTEATVITYLLTNLLTHLLDLIIHGKIFSIHYNRKFHYNYTVLQDCRVGARPAPTI